MFEHMTSSLIEPPQSPLDLGLYSTCLGDRRANVGTSGNDILSSAVIGDRIWARAGNDVVLGSDGNQWIDAGDGTDFVSGGNGSDSIWGGRGDDFLGGGSGADYLLGGTGNDVIVGGLGYDWIRGGEGDDILLGGGSNRLLGLTHNNMLVSFDPLAANQATAIPIDGLDGHLLGIDVRPADGRLYGITDTNKIYVIDVNPNDIQTITPNRAVATLVSTISSGVLNTTRLDIDFNPVPDRLRIVGENDQNLRINVDTGALADFDPNTPGIQPDGTLAFAATDPNAGRNPNLGGIGYTNSFSPSPDSTRQTTLFGLDVDLDALVRQGGANSAPPSPNSGQLFTVTQFRDVNGQVIDFGQNTGFDVATAGPVNFGYAVTDSHQSPNSQLYVLNLDLGAAVNLGFVTDRSGNAFQLIDIASFNIADFSSNLLDGGTGNDVLVGGANADVLRGGAGNDVFQSSAGNDTIVGGSGMDTIIFNTGQPLVADSSIVANPDGLGITTIQDFQSGIDKLVLDKTTFATLLSNPGSGLSQSVDFAIADTDESASSGIATIAYSRASGNLYYSATGIGSRPQTVVQFAHLANRPNLQASDFQIAP